MAEKQTGENLIGKGKPGPGRPKGVPNKINTLLKDDILLALDQAHADGRVGYLTQQAQDNPVAFLGLIGKILPTQLTGDAESPLVLNFTIGGNDKTD